MPYNKNYFLTINCPFTTHQQPVIFPDIYISVDIFAMNSGDFLSLLRVETLTVLWLLPIIAVDSYAKYGILEEVLICVDVPQSFVHSKYITHQ